MFVHTGKHARRYCPVMLPAQGDAQMVRVRLGAEEVFGQRVGDVICCIVDNAPVGVQLDARVLGPETPGTPAVELNDDGNGMIDIHVDGSPFTRYHYAGEGNRPFMHPVLGPGGVGVTRDYPMVQGVSGESEDHPHHRSLWTAHGDVNGHDDWAEGAEMARIEHRQFLTLASGPVCGHLVEALDWVSPSGVKLMREVRDIRVYHTPADHRLLDWSIKLCADAGNVRLGDTKEGGMLSVRVASTMEGSKGGAIENAWGAVGEAECWGKSAAWCDYSGLVKSEHVGIAIFDGRDNPGFPTPWHVRDYGLMTANTFGRRAFQDDNPAVNGELVIQDGASLTFKYRVFIHAGDASQADVAGRYLDFAYPPVVVE